ncbi:hypothetical protein KI387_007249, partial [Taxus chinensis]
YILKCLMLCWQQRHFQRNTVGTLKIFFVMIVKRRERLLSIGCIISVVHVDHITPG